MLNEGVFHNTYRSCTGGYQYIFPIDNSMRNVRDKSMNNHIAVVRLLIMMNCLAVVNTHYSSPYHHCTRCQRPRSYLCTRSRLDGATRGRACWRPARINN